MSYINPFRILTPQSKKAFNSDTSKNRSIFGFGNFEAVQSLIASNNYNKCDISFPIFYHIPKVEDEMNYKRICHSINTLPMYQPFSSDELHFLYEMSESFQEFKKENFPAWNARIVIGKEKVYKKYEYISNDLVDKIDFTLYDSWMKTKDINDTTFKEMNEKIKKKANNPIYQQNWGFTPIPNSNKSPFMTPSSNSINNIMNTHNPNNPFIMSNQISFNPPKTAPKPQMSFNPFTINNTQIFNSNSQNNQTNPFLTPSKSTVNSINPYSGYFSNPKIADILTTQKKIEHSDYDKMLNEAYQTFSGKNEELVDDEEVKKKKMKSLTNRLSTLHITDNKYFTTDNYSNSKLIYKKRKIGSTVMKKKPKPLLPLNISLNDSQSQSNVEIVKYTLICKSQDNDNKDICTIKSNSPYIKIKEIKEKIISSIAEQYKERQLEEKEIIIEINRNVINEDKINLEEIFPNQITNGFLSQNNIYNVFFTVATAKKEEPIKKEDSKRKLLVDDYFPIMNTYKMIYPSHESIMKMSKEELQHVKNLEIESEQCSIVFEDTIDITYVNFDLIKVDTNSLTVSIENNEHISKILTHAIIIFKNFIVDALSEDAYITQVTERCLSNLKTERYTYNRKDKELVCAVDLKNYI